MTQSRIAYNANALAMPDVNRYKPHHKKLQPVASLVIDGMGLAQELLNDSPNTIMIHREYGAYKGDDDLHLRVSPEFWIDDQLSKGYPDIWRSLLNEPGYSLQCIDWLTRAVKYNLSKPKPLKLVIGNFSVGTPGQPGHPIEEDWSHAKELLQLLDSHRDTLILGLHEYFCAVPTSGYYGGYPNHAGVDPNGSDKDKGFDLVPNDKWPKDAKEITKFHCGRFMFLENYCKSIGRKPPRVILTEHGPDDVSDIKAWSSGLHKTAPYQSITGWKSLVNQWADWYGVSPGWSSERTLLEMVTYLDKYVYQGSCVEAQLLFCWNTNPMWVADDLSGALTFQMSLEAVATGTGTISKPLPPPPAPPPVPAPPPTPIPPSTPPTDPIIEAVEFWSQTFKCKQSEFNMLKAMGRDVERVLPAPPLPLTKPAIETMISGG